jgi:F-type H+-transporting ATPase subunit b
MIDIDAGILLVQVLTFLIATFVLWKIAWKPLTVIMAKRKSDIAKSMSDAENLRLETEKLKKQYDQLVSGIDRKAQEMMAQASASAERDKQQIIISARDEAKKILEMAQRQMETERQGIREDIKKEIIPIAFSMAERILEKSVDGDIHKQLVEKFLGEIEGMKN